MSEVKGPYMGCGDDCLGCSWCVTEHNERCVVCHLTIPPEDGGLCPRHQYDEQRPKGVIR